MTPEAPPPIPARIGPYEVMSILGRGGMGVVYLARDTRLNRDVAIKMLSPGHIEPEQRARFQREALLLASLNHPNIATIHGLEEVQGVRYLILERLKGETLAERLKRGPLPPEEAFRIGIQITLALEAAHDGHVVHRDLKPGNIMLTPRGLVKVLDFGLARHDAPDVGGAPGTARDPDAGSTRTGHVTGTPGYMSPEQITARPQGPFSDMFAFGCVLYESLAGTRAFPGNASESIVGVLTGEPDWTRLPVIPEEVRRLIAHCLERDPERRVGDAVSARIVLERALGHDTDSAQRRRQEGRRHNLPRRTAGFIGREEILARAHDLLGDARLVTFTGPGGSGKTRLAIELAGRELESYPDGVRFVDLTPVSDPGQVADAAAAAFGLGDAVNALLGHLAERRVLIILDNCEHVLTAAARFVSSLVMGGPGIRIVATSRESLGVPGERVLPVPPLSVPEPATRLDPGSIMKLDAVRLFHERARLVVHDFEMDPVTALIVGDICRRLDGLPLAIELAATRVKLLSVEQIRDRLDDRFRLLKDQSGSASDRHRTLEATIDWSFDHLPDDEKALFRRLAVFAGGWSLDGAGTVDTARDEYEMLDRLARLVDKSLVIVDRSKRGEPRYRFLESIHQYARRKLAESGEEEAMRNRHLQGFLDFIRLADSHRNQKDQATWLRRIEAEHANLSAAVEWAASRPATAPGALILVGAAWRYWYDLGQAGKARKTIGVALVANADRPPDLLRAGALEGAALMALEQGDIAAARRDYEESLKIAEALGERRQQANVLNGLGAVLSDGLGDMDGSRPYFERCVAIYRELGDRSGVAKGLNNLGRVIQHQGDAARARALFEESLAERRAIGNDQGVAKSLANLVILETSLGDLATARRHLVESLRLAGQLHMLSLGASLLESSARLMAASGQPGEAARMFGAAAALRLQIDVPLLTDEREEVDERLASLRATEGAAAVESCLEAGGRLSFAEAAAEVTAWSGGESGNHR